MTYCAISVCVQRLDTFSRGSTDWQDMMGEEKVELWVNYLNECSFQYCEAATRTLHTSRP